MIVQDRASVALCHYVQKVARGVRRRANAPSALPALVAFLMMGNTA
jgi:hypothetical protein